ncbi:MAG: DUF1993 domain-containing protein [Burkholderiaceae bacterium]|nr:DUF1993 domain-containing protein [Burkholderiaceae bacterium]
MSFDLHTASVPVFQRYLERLDGLVLTAQRHTQSHKLAAHELLGARLASDMAPFSGQVEMAAHFALRACFPLAGRPVPAHGEFASDFEGLRGRIAQALALLAELSPADFDLAPGRRLESQAGSARVSLPAAEFLTLYALPNFFFHLGSAYAVLRSLGLPLGKQDFDGFHHYPSSPP